MRRVGRRAKGGIDVRYGTRVPPRLDVIATAHDAHAGVEHLYECSAIILNKLAVEGTHHKQTVGVQLRQRDGRREVVVVLLESAVERQVEDGEGCARECAVGYVLGFDFCGEEVGLNVGFCDVLCGGLHTLFISIPALSAFMYLLNLSLCYAIVPSFELNIVTGGGMVSIGDETQIVAASNGSHI